MSLHILLSFEGDKELDLSGVLPRGSKRSVSDQKRLSTLNKFVKRVLKSESFKGRSGEVLKIYLPDGFPSESLIVLGLGPSASFHPEVARIAAATARRRLPGALRGKKSSVLLHLDPERMTSAWSGRKKKEDAGPSRQPIRADFDFGDVVQAVTEGWNLGGYAFVEYRSKSKRAASTDLQLGFLSTPKASAALLKESVKRGEAVAEAVAFARDLGNTPANVLNPAALAARARSWAKQCGLQCQVLDDKAIRRERMGALISVAKGSDSPPRFLVLKYTPTGGRRGKKPLILVGKAVTFDSGGLSIKPARGMEDMKMDMAGGAAVLAALGAIARIRPSTPVIGIIPCAENMISGGATRPGDVVESRAGLMIEVVNTDAEGRMILADALDYSRRFNPRLVVDVATLTGACVVALGDIVSGMFANDPEVAAELSRASEASGELLWELPLYEPYFGQIRSNTGDIKNSGGRGAGAITAAAFLARFAEGLPWCHLDVAGTAWTGKDVGYKNRGATGFGVRLLVQLALQAR